MFKKTMVSVLAASMILVGCGSRLDGTYSNGMASYTFKSDGTVVVNTLGAKVEVEYELDGKDVRIKAPNGVMILTLLDDNTIEGPMGIKLTKQE
jgi:hypothetical protein